MSESALCEGFEDPARVASDEEGAAKTGVAASTAIATASAPAFPVRRATELRTINALHAGWTVQHPHGYRTILPRGKYRCRHSPNCHSTRRTRSRSRQDHPPMCLRGTSAARGLCWGGLAWSERGKTTQEDRLPALRGYQARNSRRGTMRRGDDRSGNEKRLRPRTPGPFRCSRSSLKPARLYADTAGEAPSPPPSVC